MEVIFAFFQSRWLIKTITVAPKEIENHKVPTIERIETRFIIVPIKKPAIKAIAVMTIKRSLCGFIKSVKLMPLFFLVVFNGYNPQINHLQIKLTSKNNLLMNNIFTISKMQQNCRLLHLIIIKLIVWNVGLFNRNRVIKKVHICTCFYLVDKTEMLHGFCPAVFVNIIGYIVGNSLCLRDTVSHRY